MYPAVDISIKHQWRRTLQLYIFINQFLHSFFIKIIQLHTYGMQQEKIIGYKFFIPKGIANN